MDPVFDHIGESHTKSGGNRSSWRPPTPLTKKFKSFDGGGAIDRFEEEEEDNIGKGARAVK